ncbi:unnamed protein product [Paramecium primaurelia]|uniref:C2 domain-containing protein n=1 Tax=Paramecium primaurelia TaxID=5886 RepID=A0A8S1PXA6_PARPR|nr:unnamed protein product [Paramecium primaurelia]
MGCLFGKKQLVNQESEISQDISIKLDSSAFNMQNESKFLGYPYYSTLTKKLGEIVHSKVAEWSQYENELNDHKNKFKKYIQLMDAIMDNQDVLKIENLPEEFNRDFKPCLIIDIQTGNFKIQGTETYYYVVISLGNNQIKEQLTSIQKSSKQMEWNEVIIFNLDDTSLNNQFKLQIKQQNKVGAKESKSVGHSITFTFEELKEQIINEKIIRLKEKEDIIGSLQMRCQLIHDVKDFALQWKKELIYRGQQIDRILQKSKLNSNDNDVQFQSLMSFHSNRQHNETVYDLQFEVQ